MKKPYAERYGHSRQTKRTLGLAKEAKRREALRRNEAWAALSREQKIAELLKRPGNSAKQLARLGYTRNG